METNNSTHGNGIGNAKPIVGAEEWKEAVAELEAQISDWSRAAGWRVVVSPPEHVEENADLLLETGRGSNLLIEDFGSRPHFGRPGLLLQAWPTMYRLRLLPNGEGRDWMFLTDSGVPIRKPWGQETFLEVANDLATAGYAEDEL